MKFAVGLAVLFSALALILADSTCDTRLDSTFPTKWTQTMKTTCHDATKNQIKAEIGASNFYLKIAAYFSRDTVNRPGFADFFFKSAKEERDHAIQLIEYLSMRGQLVSTLTSLTDATPVVFTNSKLELNNNILSLEDVQRKSKTTWNGIEALNDALELETLVTESIRGLIQACEAGGNTDNDYHFVDYLTGVYLEEQHKGQREIAGKLSTLKKMYKAHGKELAEFLFDKEL